MDDTYYATRFEADVRTHLEAGVFRALLAHLDERSNSVSNIDIMIIGGFCRNCLAKWLVKESKQLAIEIENEDSKGSKILHAFGHSQGLRQVYGVDFFRWKKKYPQKASFDQMRKYQESEGIHAVHSEDVTSKSSGMTVAMTNEFEAKYLMKLEAGVFQSLCQHLSERSDIVQNIDLMAVSGFCRNCLAKWLVVEARKLALTIRGVCQGSFTVEEAQLVNDLDRFGYDEAAEEVYGCTYTKWKIAHAKKASDDQMAKYKSSGNIHAKHDKKLLEKVTENDCEVKATSSLATRSFATEKEDESTTASRTRSLPSVASTSSRGESKHTSTRRFEKSAIPQMSNVCCEDPDHVAQAERAVSAMSIAGTKSKKKEATKPSSKFNPPPPPEGPMSLNIGILTVSDRAASGEYQTGDLSGPAVEQSLAENIGKYNSNEAQKTLLSCNFTKQGIVPDDMGEIEKMLLLWSGKTNGTSVCDLIFTTGGTGFSSRDVTPEATAKVIEKECKGLMAFVLGECSTVQPLAALSRGAAGVTGKTFIVNLPGNPEAVGEILNILFPLLLHAVKDMKRI